MEVIKPSYKMVEICRTVAKYYTCFFGLCMAVTIPFLCGWHLANLLASDSGFLRVIEGSVVAFSILLIIYFFIGSFFPTILRIPQKVKVTDEGITHRGLMHDWQQVKAIENMGSHLRVIWWNNGYCRIVHWRPLAPGSSVCQAGVGLGRTMYTEYWQPLLELLERRILLPQAKAMLQANRQVYLFHHRLYYMYTSTSVLLYACIAFVFGVLVSYIFIVVCCLLLFWPFITFKFIWVDQEGLGLFRMFSGLKYIRFSEVTQFDTSQKETRLKVDNGEDSEKDIILTPADFPNYLLLRCVIMLLVKQRCQVVNLHFLHDG